MTKKIIALGGDGIGPEILDSALEILAAASKKVGNFNYTVDHFDFGGAAIDSSGDPYPEETREAVHSADAILLGAIGGPKWEKAPKTPEDGLLELRGDLELYANLRPVEMQDNMLERSPLKEERVKGTNFMIVRELIGGIYFGRPKIYNNDQAVDVMYYTREGIERIVRTAFDLAMTRNKKVTSVDKANVLANSKLWRQIVNEIAQEYPEVEVEHLYVDAASMKIITDPTSFDVVVTANLFGDILSDEASVITGSLGMMPSASLSASGPSLYEPIHGSAPDIAGQNKANPMSMILSMTMMLRISFEENELADAIEQTCQKVIDSGVITGDLGGNASTSEFTQAVVNEFK